MIRPGIKRHSTNFMDITISADTNMRMISANRRLCLALHVAQNE
jgi:hypothetical protein